MMLIIAMFLIGKIVVPEKYDITVADKIISQLILFLNKMAM
ncbi:hypothetical protein [Lactobacillus sp. M0403]|nr:hypothetical protein [Lactobacillus sp. M0403]